MVSFVDIEEVGSSNLFSPTIERSITVGTLSPYGYFNMIINKFFPLFFRYLFKF